MPDKKKNQDVEFFMGQVSQSLRDGNKTMDQLGKNQTKIMNDVNKIKTQVQVQNGRIATQMKEYNKQLEDQKEYNHLTDEKLGRDFKDINNLKQAIDIEGASRKRSRDLITWVIGIAIFILMAANFSWTIKSNEKHVQPTIILDEKLLLKLQKGLLDSGE